MNVSGVYAIAFETLFEKARNIGQVAIHSEATLLSSVSILSRVAEKF